MLFLTLRNTLRFINSMVFLSQHSHRRTISIERPFASIGVNAVGYHMQEGQSSKILELQ